MKYSYKCVKWQLFDEQYGEYTSYGIEIDGDEEAEIRDISCDKAFVQELVRKMNLYQLDPVQLDEVIEDALGV